MTDRQPKAFVSYKWEDDAHNAWVERLATALVRGGIDAYLDRWDVPLGESFTTYMTSRINEADIVLCIITDRYVTAVEDRGPGGGAAKFEMQMATARRTAGENVRLIGVYRQGTRPPHHLRDHRYIDFRDDGKYDANLLILLADLLGKSMRPRVDAQQQPSVPSSALSEEIDGRPVNLAMQPIPAGEFMMGSPESEQLNTDLLDNERPLHRVRITEPFYLGTYPITERQYASVMGKRASEAPDECAASKVAWFNAVDFCNRLSKLEGLPPFYAVERVHHPNIHYEHLEPPRMVSVIGGHGFRLPTEAEWEYACRAGTSTRWSCGNDLTDVRRAAWFLPESERKTHPVGQKKPNPWGLYDMHGNVWEWCWDWYAGDYYQRSPDMNPSGPESGAYRVTRGGPFIPVPRLASSAYRNHNGPDFFLEGQGLRVARNQ